jgi:soluble cytochrome b562
MRKKDQILKKMYESVDKMNQYLISGDIENYKREIVAQKMLRIEYEKKIR